MATLDNSVTWSRSLTKTRCRVCRKGGDHEKMLLCDGCDKGHHMYCLKPKLKAIPEGDWFCDKCKPKLKAKSPKKNRTIYIEEDEEDEDEEDGEEEEPVPEVEEEAEDGVFEDDHCVVCLIGGNLVCCDKCPRTYHKECVQLKKVPKGTWSCPQCVAQQEKPKKSKNSTENKSNKKTEDKPRRDAVNIGNKKRKADRKCHLPDEDPEEDYAPGPCKKRRTERSSLDSSVHITNDGGRSMTRRNAIVSSSVSNTNYINHQFDEHNAITFHVTVVKVYQIAIKFHITFVKS